MVYETKKEKLKFYKLLMPTLNNFNQSKRIGEINNFDFKTIDLWKYLINEYVIFVGDDVLSESDDFEVEVGEYQLGKVFGLSAIGNLIK